MTLRGQSHIPTYSGNIKIVKNRPAEAVAVGDSPYDAEAAGKIGLRTIGVLSGGFPRESWSAPVA